MNVAFLVGNGVNCVAITDKAPITYVLGCRGKHATCVSLRWVREALCLFISPAFIKDVASNGVDKVGSLPSALLLVGQR